MLLHPTILKQWFIHKSPGVHSGIFYSHNYSLICPIGQNKEFWFQMSAARLGAVVLGQILLTQADRERSYFQILIVAHNLHASFNSQIKNRYKDNRLVHRRRTDVGLILALCRIHHHLLALGSVPDNHTLIHFCRRLYIELSAILQIPERVAERLPARHRDHRADLTLLNLTCVWLEAEHA